MGSAIKGHFINSPAATYCLLSNQWRLPSNPIQTSYFLAVTLRTISSFQKVKFLQLHKDGFLHSSLKLAGKIQRSRR